MNSTLVTISSKCVICNKAICKFYVIILEILRHTFYPIVEQTLRNFPLFKNPSFFNLLDNEVINSRSLFSHKKILKVTLIFPL